MGSTLWDMAPVVTVVLGVVLVSISPDQQSRTRFPLGDESGVTTCPRGGKCSAPVAADLDPREWVWDLHVPSGLPRALGSASCSGGVWSRHVSRRRGREWGSHRCPSSSRRHGRCCRGYQPPGVAWRRSEGPTGYGLVLFKAGAASEGRAHAVRGFRGGESMGSWQHSGWSSAEHVLHHVAGSHSVATASGMAEQ